jgi:hypothetical protein
VAAPADDAAEVVRPASRSYPGGTTSTRGGVVVAGELVDGVRQHVGEGGEPVEDSPDGPGEVHDEGASGDPGDAAGQRGGGHGLLRGVGGGQRPRAHELGDAGHLAVEHGEGGLGGGVRRGDPGPAGGDDHVRRSGAVEQIEQRVAHGLAVGHDDHRQHLPAAGGEPVGGRRARPVGVHPGGGAVGRDDDGGHATARRRGTRRAVLGGVAAHASSRDQSPDLPPDFATTSMSVRTAALSTALIMS